MRERFSETGFSLIEALVATAIFSCVLLAGATLFATNANLYKRGQTKAAAQQNARIALENICREIRMAGYDRSGVLAGLATPAAIQAATASSITFVADVTGDGTLDQVQYSLSGTTLQRSIASWSGTAFPTATSGDVAEGLSQLGFTYFDASGAAITAPVSTANLATIRRIAVAMTTAQSITGTQQSFALVEDVTLRN